MGKILQDIFIQIHPNTTATDLNVTVAKINVLDIVDIDADALTNQSEVGGVSKVNNDITVTIDDETALVAYELNGNTAKWVAIGVDTGLDDIKKVKYNENDFTDTEITEATNFGLEAGSFVLWVDADNLPSNFTLQAEGCEKQTFTISFV